MQCNLFYNKDDESRIGKARNKHMAIKCKTQSCKTLDPSYRRNSVSIQFNNMEYDKKKMEKKLDRTFIKMFRDIFNKLCRNHPTNYMIIFHQLQT